MPAPLKERIISLSAAAVLTAVVFIVASIVTKTPSVLTGLLAALYFIYLAWELRHDYQKGRILEKAVVCTGTEEILFGRGVRAYFRTPDNEEEYNFITETERKGLFKRKTPFYTGEAYLIYFKGTTLIASVMLVGQP